MAQHSLSLRAASTTLGTNLKNHRQLPTTINSYRSMTWWNINDSESRDINWNINWDIFRVQLLWEYGFRITTGAVPAQPECECSIPISVIRVVFFCGNGPRHVQHVQLSQLKIRSPWKISMDCPKNFRPSLNGSVRSGKAPAQSATTRTPEKRPAPQICHDRLQKMDIISYIATYIIYTVYVHYTYIYIAYLIVSIDKHGVHFWCQAAIAPRASCRIKVPEGWSCQRISQCISTILNKSCSQSFCVFSQNRSKIIYDHLWSFVDH